MKIIEALFKNRGKLYTVLLISIALHFLVGIIFGGAVLFKVLTKPEPQLESPPVIESIEPQKKEYKVKLQKSQKKSSAPLPDPIVAETPSDVNLEDLDLNMNMDRRDLAVGALSDGMGEGDGSGDAFGSGFDMDIDLDMDISLFGSSQFGEGKLEGTLFDLKTDTDGDPIENANSNERSYSGPIMREFTEKFRMSLLEKEFFQADKKLYSSYFAIPSVSANKAPEAFGVEGIIKPRLIAAVYQGTFTPAKSGKFRFVGRGDDVLVVRIKNDIVFDGSWQKIYSDYDVSGESHSEASNGTFGIGPPSDVGEWFTLKAGEAVNLEILLAEIPGGFFGAYLLIEEKGEEGLQLFSTRELSPQDLEHLSTLHSDINKYVSQLSD